MSRPPSRSDSLQSVRQPSAGLAKTPEILPEDRMRNATVILAAGEFPSHPLALEALDSARHLVCCDGAVRALARRGRPAPDVVVGDFDSLPASARRHFPDALFHHEAEQDTNDLAKAFRFCLARRWPDPVILGASGRREDHFLANFALLADFSVDAPGIRMLTDHGLFLVLRSGARIRCGAGRSVSLFSLDPAQRLSSEGLRYPLDGVALDSLWRATLNVADRDVVSLSLERPSPVIVYLAHPGRPRGRQP